MAILDMLYKQYICYLPLATPTPSRVLLSLKPSQVDIDAEDEDGWTPLHAAVYWGNAEIAEELVDHGADVNKKTQLVRLYMYIKQAYRGGGAPRISPSSILDSAIIMLCITFS